MLCNDIAFAIPSYKRCGKVATLNMLEAYGVPKANIYIYPRKQMKTTKNINNSTLVGLMSYIKKRTIAQETETTLLFH